MSWPEIKSALYEARWALLSWLAPITCSLMTGGAVSDRETLKQLFTLCCQNVTLPPSQACYSLASSHGYRIVDLQDSCKFDFDTSGETFNIGLFSLAMTASTVFSLYLTGRAISTFCRRRNYLPIDIERPI